MINRFNFFDIEIPFEKIISDKCSLQQIGPFSDEAMARLQKCASVSVMLEINQDGEIVNSSASVNHEKTSRNYEVCYDPQCSHFWAIHYSVDENFTACKSPGCGCQRFVTRNEYEIGQQSNALAIRPASCIART